MSRDLTITEIDVTVPYQYRDRRHGTLQIQRLTVWDLTNTEIDVTGPYQYRDRFHVASTNKCIIKNFSEIESLANKNINTPHKCKVIFMLCNEFVNKMYVHCTNRKSSISAVSMLHGFGIDDAGANWLQHFLYTSLFLSEDLLNSSKYLSHIFNFHAISLTVGLLSLGHGVLEGDGLDGGRTLLGIQGLASKILQRKLFKT